VELKRRLRIGNAQNAAPKASKNVKKKDTVGGREKRKNPK
jgi:hypothetical protein